MHSTDKAPKRQLKLNFAHADAERIVLASILSDAANDEFPDGTLFLFQQDQIIHRGLAELKLSGKSADIVTLIQELVDSGRSAAGGGGRGVNAVPTGRKNPVTQHRGVKKVNSRLHRRKSDPPKILRQQMENGGTE